MVEMTPVLIEKKNFFKPFIELINEYKAIFFSLLSLLLLIVTYTVISQKNVNVTNTRAIEIICGGTNYAECIRDSKCFWNGQNCKQTCLGINTRDWTNKIQVCKDLYYCYWNTSLNLCTDKVTPTPTESNCSQYTKSTCESGRLCIWINNKCVLHCIAAYDDQMKCKTLPHCEWRQVYNYVLNIYQGTCEFTTAPTQVPPAPTLSCKTIGQNCQLPRSQSNCCNGLTCNDTYVCGAPTATPTPACKSSGQKCVNPGYQSNCCFGFICTSTTITGEYICITKLTNTPTPVRYVTPTPSPVTYRTPTPTPRIPTRTPTPRYQPL